MVRAPAHMESTSLASARGEHTGEIKTSPTMLAETCLFTHVQYSPRKVARVSSLHALQHTSMNAGPPFVPGGVVWKMGPPGGPVFGPPARVAGPNYYQGARCAEAPLPWCSLLFITASSTRADTSGVGATNPKMRNKSLFTIPRLARILCSNPLVRLGGAKHAATRA